MVPPAPTTFSITTACFSVALIEFPSRRAITSPGPPAENGTTSVIGRLGNSCANPGATGTTSSSTSSTRFTNFMATSCWPCGSLKQLDRDEDRSFIRDRLCVRGRRSLDHGERGHGRRLDVIDAALLGE